ncbi:Replication protein a dna-binding subunit b [Thalictrum thalictroides]|uniref:Replication protein A subunit n=1 Tax=Thalictrum thalictroides TaxID=46969 RepID=A0A7J6XAG3_THATH|nr:Replication protein a dna-binding subunit b [Thalictrum thalictroides]
MAEFITPNAISTIIANPSPDSSDLVVQVVDLVAIGKRYKFTASDGNMKLKAILPPSYSSEIETGSLQNLGLIRILSYTLNEIPPKREKCLIVTKFEVVTPVLDMEIKSESEIKNETEIISETNKVEPGIVLKPKNESGIQLKPKQEMITKSAAEILLEQHGNNAPSARMGMTRRVFPLVSLNPYQGNWTIKVRVTSKGNLRTYKNARGEGQVFNVELTDQDGTQIQATMFNEAAKKFYDKFELGKVYYISKGTLRVANKQFKTVKNDYEMTLNENSQVEEVVEEGTFIPETKFNFVPIDELGSYVNGKELADVVGVVLNVSPTLSIRRKLDNESIPKRDITIADESKKTVVVSLWNDFATTIGQELLDTVDTAPIVAFKSLKVGDFQGVSLSTLGKSTVLINPDIPEAKKLRSWYNTEGKGTSMDSVGSGIVSNTSRNGARSMYSDRVCISHITSNPSLGDDKPEFFCLKAYISYIKPDQTMWYRACKHCNKKVVEAIGSGYSCEACQKNDNECNLRYIMVVKVADPSGEAWLSVFNEQAEQIIGCSAEELDRMKKDGNDNLFNLKLKEATWAPHLFRVSVTQNEYNNEKRQRITVRAEAPLDFVAESKFLLEEISKMQAS